MSSFISQEEVLQAVQEFIGAENLAQKLRVVEVKSKLLLTDEADQLLETSIQHFAEDADATLKLQQHRSLLQNCRRQGIEAAFAELSDIQNSPDKLNEIIQALGSQLKAWQICHGGWRYVSKR